MEQSFQRKALMITGDQVLAAMKAADIIYVPHHDCSLCGVKVNYFREGDLLFFDPSCDCTRGSGPEPRTWDDPAEWINMQDNEVAREMLKKRFGLE